MSSTARTFISPFVVTENFVVFNAGYSAFTHFFVSANRCDREASIFF